MPEQMTTAEREPNTPAAPAPRGRGPQAPKKRRGAFASRGLPRPSAKAIVGGVILLILIVFALLGPVIAQYEYNDSNNPALVPPGVTHWMGTTSLGYDVFAQLAAGARTSLYVGFCAGIIAVVLSVLFGVIAGYLGGWVDEFLTLCIGVFLDIPGLPLAIVISTLMPGRSATLVAIILGLTGWAGSAVVLRSQAQSLRNRDYVAAARISGERPMRIITVEILPNLLPLLTGQFLFGIIFAVLGEAGLSFLGLGPTGSISWGTILNQAQSGGALTRGAWWWFIPPGLLIAALGCSLALINFSVDEVINPKLRAIPKAARRVGDRKKIRKARS